MSAFLSSLDASSKRLLAAFVLAAVVTIGVLMHSFLSAITPPKEIVNPQPFPVTAVETRASSQPAWDSAQQNRSTEYPQNIPPTPPSERRATATWVTPTNWQEMVHMQAEYLRKQSAESQDPGGIGKLTPEQIDEMEKNGLLAE